MKRYVQAAITFLSIFCLLICVFNNREKNFATDGERFQYEYESVNGKRDDYGEKMRNLSISAENPMVYESYEGVIERIEGKETFVVYFGYAKCPWCRGAMEAILNSAKQCNVNTIYYVDVYNSRDLYELKDGNAVQKKKGENGYVRLLTLLENVLSDYELANEDGTLLNVGEKRIYAPNLIVVKEGKPIGIAADSSLFTDPYGTITEEISLDMQKIYNELFLLLQ